VGPSSFSLSPALTFHGIPQCDSFKRIEKTFVVFHFFGGKPEENLR